jgi:putative Ca2+/H+ antiporter (TMEM165/GDT1 family)
VNVSFTNLAESQTQDVSISPANPAPASENTVSPLVVLEECRSLDSIPLQPLEKKSNQWNLFGVFGSTFITIFLAELGDKTQVATLLMSAESHAPWLVFAGAASALVATSLIGVLLGQWLSTRLSPRTLDVSAGITLLLVAAMLLWDVVQG